jgi:(S)-3,5-dihydroxyphenylglycine transaminase
VRLRREDLHRSVHDPVASSMTFLNEIASRYPDAISLAAGRPYDGFYEIEDVHRFLAAYLEYRQSQGASRDRLRELLLQYGRTNGQIHDLIASHLALDEGIDVAPEAVAVTAGAQEGMIIALRGLCAGPRDVLLAAEPCYVGITGAARLLDVDVVGVPETAHGVDPVAVAEVAERVRRSGRRPRLLYCVPDFANPSGVSLNLATRRRLLDVADAEDLLILEDNPYGLFGLADDSPPTLKSLDARHRVLYLGSFAKAGFPGARVGYLVADQEVVAADGTTGLLASELSTVKSMLTVNTSPVAQATVGGLLVSCGCSLRMANAAKRDFYRNNMRTLLAALADSFPPSSGVTWNTPAGGFFAVLDVPVTADAPQLERSAAEFGVLWTPMSFFYLDGGGEQSIRLSISWLEPDAVVEGVRRLARMLAAASG